MHADKPCTIVLRYMYRVLTDSVLLRNEYRAMYNIDLISVAFWNTHQSIKLRKHTRKSGLIPTHISLHTYDKNIPAEMINVLFSNLPLELIFPRRKNILRHKNSIWHELSALSGPVFNWTNYVPASDPLVGQDCFHLIALKVPQVLFGYIFHFHRVRFIIVTQ